MKELIVRLSAIPLIAFEPIGADIFDGSAMAIVEARA